jgi:hypothetical protein
MHQWMRSPPLQNVMHRTFNVAKRVGLVGPGGAPRHKLRASNLFGLHYYEVSFLLEEGEGRRGCLGVQDSPFPGDLVFIFEGKVELRFGLDCLPLFSEVIANKCPPSPLASVTYHRRYLVVFFIGFPHEEKLTRRKAVQDHHIQYGIRRRRQHKHTLYSLSCNLCTRHRPSLTAISSPPSAYMYGICVCVCVRLTSCFFPSEFHILLTN